MPAAQITVALSIDCPWLRGTLVSFSAVSISGPSRRDAVAAVYSCSAELFEVG